MNRSIIETKMAYYECGRVPVKRQNPRRRRLRRKLINKTNNNHKSDDSSNSNSNSYNSNTGDSSNISCDRQDQADAELESLSQSVDC